MTLRRTTRASGIPCRGVAPQGAREDAAHHAERAPGARFALVAPRAANTELLSNPRGEALSVRVVVRPDELVEVRVGKRLGAHLKEIARDRLAGASDDYAARLGRPYARLSLRDTRSLIRRILGIIY